MCPFGELMASSAADDLNGELGNLAELASVLGVEVDLNAVDAAAELDRVDAEFSNRITQYPESVQAKLQQQWQHAFQPIRAKVVLEQERLLKEAAKADEALAKAKEKARVAQSHSETAVKTVEDAVTTAEATAESFKESAETLQNAASEILMPTEDESAATEKAAVGDSKQKKGSDVGERAGTAKSKKETSQKKNAKSSKKDKKIEEKASLLLTDDTETESQIIAPIIELIMKLETEKIASRRIQIIDSNISKRLRLLAELEIPAGKASGHRMPNDYTDGRRLSCTLGGQHHITLLTPASINKKMDNLNVGEVIDIGVVPSSWNLALNRLELVATRREK